MRINKRLIKIPIIKARNEKCEKRLNDLRFAYNLLYARYRYGRSYFYFQEGDNIPKEIKDIITYASAVARESPYFTTLDVIKHEINRMLSGNDY